MEILNDAFHVILTSLGSLIALFIIAKILGARQISQLSMFDYAIGITLGSIAAEMATGLDTDYIMPLISMAIYTAVAALLALAARKNQKMREMLQGRPLVLYKEKKIYRANMAKGKISINEMLSQARVAGYFDLADLSVILLEENGQLSFLPKSEMRPVNPQDLQLHPDTAKMTHNIIVDGRLITQNLEHCGLDMNWLEKQLNAEKTGSIADVMLGVYDGDRLTVYKADNAEYIPETLL